MVSTGSPLRWAARRMASGEGPSHTQNVVRLPSLTQEWTYVTP